jgi:hypothetical protein
MATDQDQHVEIPIDYQLGIYNSVQPTSLPVGGYLLKKNAYQNKIGSNSKRPGSAPVTTSALSATIPYLTVYQKTNAIAELLASSGTTLYRFNAANFDAITMTNALESSNIYSVGFTDTALNSVLCITDGGDFKFYQGSAVANVTPSPNDALSDPPNGLAAINLLNPIYCWVHAGHVFLSTGDDVVYYSKRSDPTNKKEYAYFPTTFYQRFVRNNDYATGPGISYGDVMMLPMRRGWGVMTGTDSTNFAGNKFLNTVSGNIAPRAIAKLTDPNGEQTIAFLSDDGVYEIYDTGFVDSSGVGSRNYATRSLMKNKIDFSSYGFTDAEKIAANAYFDSITNMYILCIKRSTTSYAFVYDVRNKEWSGLWENIKAESTIRFNNMLLYAGSTKLLHAYDDRLGTDYNEIGLTTGTAIDWDCYLDVIMMENTGFQSNLDYVIINAKNFLTPSTIDITIVGTSQTTVYEDAVQSNYATWDVSLWDFCVLANPDFSTIVGAPSRTLVKRKAYFFQIRLQNNRDELVELYKIKLIGRISGN